MNLKFKTTKSGGGWRALTGLVQVIASVVENQDPPNSLDHLRRSYRGHEMGPIVEGIKFDAKMYREFSRDFP